MSQLNEALVLHPSLELKVEKVPIPEPKPEDVVLAIHSTGICGTDLHMAFHGHAGAVSVTKPMVLGHESSGTVVKVGERVKNLKIGDRVTVEPAIPCLNCKFCLEGRYNLCPNLDGRGYPNDGMCTHHYAHPALFCFKLPDNVSLEEGALVEPLAVAVHACRRAGIEAGKTLFILGAGPIGLLTLLVAKAMGIGKIVISDVNRARLDIAKSIGAYAIIQTTSDSDITQAVSSALGEAPDLTIDCCGSAETVEKAILATRCGGIVTVVGLGGQLANISLADVVMRELEVRGVSRYVNCYPIALSLLESGAVDVRPLVTHRFPLKEARKAFQVAHDAQSGAVKVIIQTQSS